MIVGGAAKVPCHSSPCPAGLEPFRERRGEPAPATGPEGGREERGTEEVPSSHPAYLRGRRYPRMSTDEHGLPPELERVLDRFALFGREQTMQALVDYAKRFPPLPERFAGLADDEEYKVHECMTPVALFSEVDDAGNLRFWADVPESAPTIRALIAIFTEALNGKPPETVLAIPPDFVSTLMRKVGLSTRERGLNAMVARMKRHAREALAA